MHEVLLRKMKIDQKGTISSVNIGQDMGRRLREMGLTPGAVIKVSGRAPLKDPVAVKVLDCTLTLRNNEADHIIVSID